MMAFLNLTNHHRVSIMNAELEQKIYSIDEVFFRERDYDKTITCMCWGIECGDGWYEPIKGFVERVAVLNSALKSVNMCIVCEQMKSKWSEFTCYWGIEAMNDDNQTVELDEKGDRLCQAVDSMMRDTVNRCELECSKTCEICGKHEPSGRGIMVCGSWLTVKCTECVNRENRKEEKQ